LLSVLVAGVISLSAIPGCVAPGIPSSFVAAVRVSAVALPIYDIPESELEAHAGAVPFSISLRVEALEPGEDLGAGPLSPSDINGRWVSESRIGATARPDPIVAQFGFRSDGLRYLREDDTGGADTPSVVSKEESGSHVAAGDDVSFAWAVWTQDMRGEPEGTWGELEEEEQRVWYNSFTLASDEMVTIGMFDFGSDVPDADPVIELSDPDDWDSEAVPDMDLLAHNGLLVWEIDANDLPEYVYVPIAPVATISRIEPESGGLPFQSWPDPVGPESYWLFFEESGYDTTTNTSIEEDPLLAAVVFDATGPEAAEIDAFRLNRDIEFGSIQPYGEYLAASAAAPALAEALDPEDTTRDLDYYAFGPAFFVDDDPEGGDDPGGEAEVGSFGFVSDGTVFGATDTTVLCVPVDSGPLFSSDEPNTINLPYIFWLSLLPEAVPQPEEPQDESPSESLLAVSIEPVSETIEDESGCRSILTIGYGAADLTGGTKPISDVSLSVDGEQLYPWSGSPTDHYQDSILLESGCSEVHVVQVTARNVDDQTVTASSEARVPPLSTHFTYGILDVPGEGECRMQLFIEYEAVDLTTPDSPLTNVVVKANGSVWRDSGAISTDRYADSFSREVGCGHVYLIEVKGTDADGSTYTYRQTVNVPVSTPPEPPEPPAPPPPQTTLYAASAASAQCTASGPECSCSLSISFDGKDLTGGDYPVTRVVLRVNGQVWHDSGSVSTTQYHQTVQKTVGCGETFSIAVTVNNSIGQTATSSGSLTTPVP